MSSVSSSKIGNMSVFTDHLLSKVASDYFRSAGDSDHQTIHTIAFSGGVDSSLVAFLLHTVVNNIANLADRHCTRAVLGVSPALSSEQRQQAHAVAAHIGIDFLEVETTEGSKPIYIENSGQACYACKTTLYSTLRGIYDASRKPKNSHNELYNGTNKDDMQDATRVGLVAAAEFHVHSPIQTLDKATVREVAHHVGLPNAFTAASPCLRSRLQVGVPALSRHLAIIEHAERFVRQEMQLEETVNLRVRFLAKKKARIEIDADHVEKLRDLCQRNPALWGFTFLEELGFRSFDVAAFRTGSVARA
jgi:pyridinium-3,5-biscarboxylic acid mononucleotide sulfurtransferase